MHKKPRIWIMYLQSPVEQKLITRTRRRFNRALCALPVTQHDRIWEMYLVFVRQKGIPIETSLRVYRRYLKCDPSHIEDFIEFLVNSGMWQESAEILASVLNDDALYSIKGKTKHRLWLELCDPLAIHAKEVPGLNVDATIRGGIGKFPDEVGRLWTSLADYYVRRSMFEKAREIFEEGMRKVVTLKNFSVIFDAYSQFEESVISHKMESLDTSDEEEDESIQEEIEEDLDVDQCKSKHKFERKILRGFWLDDDKDIDLRLAHLEYLMNRRPELVNGVLLRQNPHKVEQWHRRVKIFEGNPIKQILTYTEAVKTVDPMKAVGKPHTLWVAYAKLYENHKDISNARVIFDKAVQVNCKTVDNMANVWCKWAEMERRHENYQGALELKRRATAEPSVEVKRRVAADNEPVEMKVHKSLRLWTFYADLEKDLGTLESTTAAYERILDLRIATPQIITKYAFLLEENKYLEDAFKVYERGVKIFKYTHVKDIWVTYLSYFVERYGKFKLERARELFEHAIEIAPADAVKQLYLQYAKLEENCGLAKRATKIYDEAIKAVPNEEKPSTHEEYIARAAEIFGIPKTREIYQQAIESGLRAKDVKAMCLKYAEQEKRFGEIDRSRCLYKYASQFSDPCTDGDFWNKGHEFEVQHGDEDTFREMLKRKGTVSASYSQPSLYLPRSVRQLSSASNNVNPQESSRILGFVSAGVESQTAGGMEPDATEDIGMPEERVEIVQKDVPSSVLAGGVVRKRDADALERIKRRKTF